MTEDFTEDGPAKAIPELLDHPLYYQGRADGWATGMAKASELADKARNLVALLDDAEVNHGSLIGPKTLRAVGELRLELSRWK